MEGIEMEKKPNARIKELGFLDTFGILKESLKIPLKNPNFITFAAFTTLPLFCTLFVYELLVQHTSIQISSHLKQLLHHSNTIPKPTRLIHEMSTRILQLLLLYKVPVHLLNLLTTITIVDSASLIYMGGRLMSVREMLHQFISKTRWKGPLVTSIYVSLLFDVSFVVITTWGVAGPLVASKNVFLAIIYVMGLVIALGKWLEYSALWNMGIVISVLEEKNGVEAMSTSSYFSRGSRLCGFYLMLFHFIYWFSISIVSLPKEGASGRIAVAFFLTGLICLGKVMKWVVCMVYYYDCKIRHREKIEDGVLYTVLP